MLQDKSYGEKIRVSRQPVLELNQLINIPIRPHMPPAKNPALRAGNPEREMRRQGQTVPT